jgi:hypothetical protein
MYFDDLVHFFFFYLHVHTHVIYVHTYVILFKFISFFAQLHIIYKKTSLGPLYLIPVD